MFQHVRLGPKRSKYGNIPTMVDGIRFASKSEAEHYARLALQRDAQVVRPARDKVRFFCLQPVFVLSEGITYRADFLVVYEDGRVEVQDVKGGPLTKVYRIKRKLMRSVHGVEIVEITR